MSFEGLRPLEVKSIHGEHVLSLALEEPDLSMQFIFYSFQKGKLVATGKSQIYPLILTDRVAEVKEKISPVNTIPVAASPVASLPKPQPKKRVIPTIEEQVVAAPTESFEDKPTLLLAPRVELDPPSSNHNYKWVLFVVVAAVVGLVCILAYSCCRRRNKK